MEEVHLFSNAFEQCAYHLDNITKRRQCAKALDTFQGAKKHSTECFETICKAPTIFNGLDKDLLVL